MCQHHASRKCVLSQRLDYEQSKAGNCPGGPDSQGVQKPQFYTFYIVQLKL